MYADVLIEYTNKSIDKTFTYLIPNELINTIKVGMIVNVGFGKKIVNGLIINIHDTYNKNYDLKSILNIVDTDLIFDKEMFSLATYLAKETICSKMSAVKCMLPSSLKLGSKKHDYNKYDTYIKLNDFIDITEYINKNKKYPKRIELIKYLIDNTKVLKKDIKSSVLNTLIKDNIVILEKEKVYRIVPNKDDNYIKPILTKDQENAVNSVKLNEYSTYLLHGVTGSGKTEVYMELIDKVLLLNKTALVLIPEISLTTQIISRFYQRFGNIVAIFNSALSEGEKYDEYQKIYHNEIKIVVGTRSAIFTPLKNIGLIILDEEHSDTYKQETNPKYDTLDMAKFRAEYNNAPLILGSATPSLESMARAKKGVYTLIEMPNRVGKSILPKIDIVDMRSEVSKKNYIISELLDNLIKETLSKKEQIILLLNRRGYSTIITCSSCGYTYKCPNCDISLTYHNTNNTLRCHYCGYTLFKSSKCPKCHEESLNYLGIGTEKLENIIKEKYPNSRVVRMDTDTTQNKGTHEKIITSFRNYEYDILIGTQMVSKGLDFPLVTLVGVINCDTSLNMPDFRSGERTYALLSQVAGRAGRSNRLGRVILQTFNPDNQYLEFVCKNDYNLFYNYEMQFRKKLQYPPYYYLVSILITSKDYKNVDIESKKIFNYLKNNISKSSLIYGPTPSLVFKINNIYRMQIMIKYRYDDLLYNVLKYIDSIYANDRKIKLEICFNPNRM